MVGLALPALLRQWSLPSSQRFIAPRRTPRFGIATARAGGRRGRTVVELDEWCFLCRGRGAQFLSLLPNNTRYLPCLHPAVCRFARERLVVIIAVIPRKSLKPPILPIDHNRPASWAEPRRIGRAIKTHADEVEGAGLALRPPSANSTNLGPGWRHSHSSAHSQPSPAKPPCTARRELS